MTRVFIALGSNIHPEHNLAEAVRLLSEYSHVLAVSHVYETAPVGTLNQPNFLNAAALIETDLPAADLKAQVLQPIEQALGRTRTADKNAARTIDLDIALYGDAVFELGSRHIPDPDILRYAHVAVPLADLAPEYQHPETGQSLATIAVTLSDATINQRTDIHLSPSALRASEKPPAKETLMEHRITPLDIRPSDYDVFRNDLTDIPDQACTGNIECAVRDILDAIGEDVTREGLLDTPSRVARAYAELTAGYHVDPVKLINDALFDVQYDQMVIVRDIDFYSLCEHHMLPFLGQVHVAYIPKGKVIGLSKIPRIVEMFARRLQVQERMTQEIAEFLDETLHPQGVAVVAEGLHMCAAMRGVKKANARMVTSAMLGTFKDNATTRAEFFGHIGREHINF